MGRSLGASAEEIKERWTALFSFGMYIDDAAASSVDDLLVDGDGAPLLRDGQQLRRSTLHWEAALAELRKLGYESELSKEQPPALELSALGVHINLADGRMRLGEKKRISYARRARAIGNATTCSRDDMVSLLGRLSFAATCYPRGHEWVAAAWRAARAQYRLRDGSVKVTKAARVGLLRWARELERPDHAGVPLASRRMRAVGSDGVGAVYADASGEGGFMAWTVAAGELLYVEDTWSETERESMPIHAKELLASTLGVVAFAPVAGFSEIYSFTDSMLALCAIRGRTPASGGMQQLVAERSEWLLENAVLEAGERITSKANLWADWGSRGRLEDVLVQARHLGLEPRRVDIDARWRSCVSDADLWC